VIDTGTNTVTTTIMVQGPDDLAITPDGRYVYVTVNTGTNAVQVIDTTTNTVVQTILMPSPESIAITPDGKYAYVTNQGADTVSVIEIATNTIVTTIPTLINPDQIAITPNGKTAYVGYFDPNPGVSVIDIATNTLTQTISGINTALGIAVDPTGSLVYVTNQPANSVIVIQTATNTISTTIPVGTNPIGVAFTPVASAPLNLTGGQQRGTDSGLEREYVNVIQWEANPDVFGATGYNVYRNGVKIATVSATTFQYEDHNQRKGATVMYAVTSFSAGGSESLPISIVVQ
jgi:YVTN family beta-propeller protein